MDAMCGLSETFRPVLPDPCALWSSSNSDVRLLVCQLRHRHSRRRRLEPSTNIVGEKKTIHLLNDHLHALDL